VLAPPTPSASHTSAGKDSPLRAPSPSHSSITPDSLFFDPVTYSAGSGAASVRPSPSLLDEEDEFGMADVLKPKIKAGTPKAPNESQKTAGGDEWNW